LYLGLKEKLEKFSKNQQFWAFMKNESAVWDQLREGRQSALKEIYNAYFDVLINYGMRMSARHELVEDSVQELFVDLWNMRSGLSPTDSVKNYLICSYRRKLIRKLKIGPEQTDETILNNQESPEPDFLNFLIQDEDAGALQRKLAAAMDTLSSRQKEAIFLKYNEGMDYDQLCEAMDLKYQSVRNLISTGIARLREQMLFLIIFTVWLSTSAFAITLTFREP